MGMSGCLQSICCDLLLTLDKPTLLVKLNESATEPTRSMMLLTQPHSTVVNVYIYEPARNPSNVPNTIKWYVCFYDTYCIIHWPTQIHEQCGTKAQPSRSTSAIIWGYVDWYHQPSRTLKVPLSIHPSIYRIRLSICRSVCPSFTF